MRLTRLRLRQFGRHEDLTIEPTASTGIVGPNGSGKSTILAALQLALTGSSPTSGAKGADVRFGSSDSSVSSVTLEFDHAGVGYRVVRGLRRMKSILETPGEATVIGDRAINDRLAGVLGVTLDLLPDFVFVRQGKICSFLDQTAGDRSQAFSALFGTRKAELAWDLCGRELSSLRVPARPEQLDHLPARIAETERAIAELRCRISEFADLEGYDPNADPNLQIVRNRGAYLDARKRIESVEQSLQLMQFSVDGYRRSLETFDGFVRQAEERLARATESRTEAERRHYIWESYKAWAREKDVNGILRRTLGDEESRNLRPKKPDDYSKPSDGDRARLADLSGQIENLHRLGLLFRGGIEACPHCGTPRESVPGLDSLLESLPALEEERRALADRLARCDEYDRAFRRWKDWAIDYGERAAVLERRDQDLGVVEMPDFPKPVMKMAQVGVDIAQSQLNLAVEEQARIRESLASSGGAVSQQEVQLQELKDLALSLKVPKAAAARAAPTASETSRRLAQCGLLKGELQSLERKLAEDRETLARLEAEAARGDRIRGWAELVADVREVLHRDAAPRILALNYMEAIGEETNDLLEEFDAPFRVRNREDLSFDAVFHDGTIQPATRLSGGQKVLLAVAFRVGVNSLFTGDIGVLALDEPTEFLDDQNLRCLEVALRRLRQLSESRGLQCLLVTHEMRLAGLFDSVVNLQ